MPGDRPPPPREADTLPGLSLRLDLPLAIAAWLLGFGWLAHAGSWMPLAGLALAAAARLAAGDAATRRLLRPALGTTAAGAAVGAASVAVTYGLYPAAAAAWPGLSSSVEGLYRMLAGGPSARWQLLLAVAAVGAAEEIVWRGRLLPGAPAGQGAGERRAPLAPALGLAAVYGLVHLASGSWLLPAVAFACGLAWGALRIATRSLWAPLVAHLVWSVAVLVVRPLA